tara:strand:+ start:304 stop:756 length:453 start_codon:yes stop_codon:yes gene_type:complete
MIIIRSFLIAAVVSVLFGFGLKNVFGFWEASVLAFVLQFITAFVYSSFKISKNTTLTAEFESELEQLLSLSKGAVLCPCGNYTHTDNIFLNVENGYTCEKCNNEFRIDISLTPTLLTTPMDVSKQFQNITEEPTKDISFTKQEYTKGTEL